MVTLKFSFDWNYCFITKGNTLKHNSICMKKAKNSLNSCDKETKKSSSLLKISNLPALLSFFKTITFLKKTIIVLKFYIH